MDVPDPCFLHNKKPVPMQGRAEHLDTRGTTLISAEGGRSSGRQHALPC